MVESVLPVDVSGRQVVSPVLTVGDIPSLEDGGRRAWRNRLGTRGQCRRSTVALGLDRAYGGAQLRDDGLLIRPHTVTIAKPTNATSVRRLLVGQQTRTLVAQAGVKRPLCGVGEGLDVGGRHPQHAGAGDVVEQADDVDAAGQWVGLQRLHLHGDVDHRQLIDHAEAGLRR